MEVFLPQGLDSHFSDIVIVKIFDVTVSPLLLDREHVVGLNCGNGVDTNDLIDGLFIFEFFNYGSLI